MPVGDLLQIKSSDFRKCLDYLLYQATILRLESTAKMAGVKSAKDAENLTACPTVNLAWWTLVSKYLNDKHILTNVETDNIKSSNDYEINVTVVLMLFSAINFAIQNPEDDESWRELVATIWGENDQSGGPAVLRALFALSPGLSYECCLIPLIARAASTAKDPNIETFDFDADCVVGNSTKSGQDIFSAICDFINRSIDTLEDSVNVPH